MTLAGVRPDRRVAHRVRVTLAPVDVARSRFEEAQLITNALVERLARERSEVAGTVDADRVRVLRRIEVTRLLLVDARQAEVRAFEEFETARTHHARTPRITRRVSDGHS